MRFCHVEDVHDVARESDGINDTILGRCATALVQI